MSKNRLFGADRAVLYQEDPVNVLGEIDGSRSTAIRSSIEKFLDAPDSTFAKTVDDQVWQVRDLKTNTRAFCTWCQNETTNTELCVVHVVYKKANEQEFFRKTPLYSTEGGKIASKYAALGKDQHGEFLDHHGNADGRLLVTE